MARPVSIAGAQALQSTNAPLLSTVELWLTNLRLLDLDLQPDWPNISAATFSSKDANQNQKERIRCTEWALYRLFEIWDPVEARDKLQPFFPPLEPLQSLNLRAALYRSLNDLKKNGVFGREIVLRKTMLDECKGDKLMEVLAAFSAAIVRRLELARPRTPHDNPISNMLATATILDAVQQGSLIPLSIALTASIRTTLRRKQERQVRLDRFSDLLDVKASQLKDRLRVCNEAKDTSITTGEEEQMKKLLNENWPGNSKWPRAVLYGDDDNAGDLPLQQPFSEIWKVVAEGGQFPVDPQNVGLLGSLEQRVSQQADRLRKWHDFHDKFLRASIPPPSIDNKSASQGQIAFKFNKHRDLRLGTNIGHNCGNPPVPPSAQRYQDVLTSVKRDLFAATKCKKGASGGATDSFNEHAIFSPIKFSTLQTVSATVDRSNLEVRPVLPKVPFQFLSLSSAPDIASVFPPRTKPQEACSPVPQSREEPAKTQVIPSCESPGATSPARLIEEEYPTEQIVDSVLNGTPSPPKTAHFTLAERTRMSMAGALRSHSKILQETPPLPPAEPPVRGIEIHNRRETLLERTRQSMSHVSHAPTMQSIKSKNGLVRKSNRESLFPINQFETPGKSTHGPVESKRNATPTEKLYSENAEYTSVFKSRPKIALSPVWSPSEGSPAVPQIDGDLEDDVQGQIWDSSPLARRGIAG